MVFHFTDRIAKQAAKLYGEEDAILAFDPSGFEKEGKNSAGVARQYLGRFGKVDNGQVGTFLAYVTRKEHVLVNGKLFIPQEWNDNPTRCEKAHIGWKIVFVARKTNVVWRNTRFKRGRVGIITWRCRCWRRFS